MKKFVSIILTLALVFSMTAAAIAEESRWSELYFYNETDVLSYIVTIPSFIPLSLDDNWVEFSISDIKNLEEGYAVGITLEDASHIPGVYPRYLALEASWYYNVQPQYDRYVRFEIHGPNQWAESLDHGKGALLSYYWHDWTDHFSIKITSDESRIAPNTPYHGYIVFGIKVIQRP